MVITKELGQAGLTSDKGSVSIPNVAFERTYRSNGEILAPTVQDRRRSTPFVFELLPKLPILVPVLA